MIILDSEYRINLRRRYLHSGWADPNALHTLSMSKELTVQRYGIIRSVVSPKMFDIWQNLAPYG